MNKAERRIIYEVSDILSGIPLPTQAKLSDIQYVADMREARPLINRVLIGLVTREPIDAVRADLATLQAWFDARRAANWRVRSLAEEG